MRGEKGKGKGEGKGIWVDEEVSIGGAVGRFFPEFFFLLHLLTTSFFSSSFFSTTSLRSAPPREKPDLSPSMPSHKRLLALAALAALVVAALFASPASADWCGDQRARCLKRCGGKESDMDFDCRDKNNARSVSCSCTNGNSGFSGGDNGASSFAGSGSGAGAFAGTGFGVGGMTPDQVARDGFNNVARVARGESPFFGGDSASGGSGNSGGSGGGDSGAAGGKQQTPSNFDASLAAGTKDVQGGGASSSQSSTPAWAVALAVIASLVAAACAGALGFVVMRRSHDRKAAAMATPSLPMYDSSKPSFAPASPSKPHAEL